MKHSSTKVRKSAVRKPCPYRVAVSSSFSAAHNLTDYKGACESLHGHNWKVELVVGSNSLNKQAMVMDFSEMKRILSDVLSKLDHKYLNELPQFKKKGKNANLTSEVIAEYIAGEIEKSLPPLVSLCEVSVWESDTSRATFSP
ncbi:MAG: 6-carboxytetrahydropterin synthase QueD [Planctomycetota bacterium]|nr:6-carboxytetrahydropterin synthase QueD [Planctomycetota bacterium]